MKVRFLKDDLFALDGVKVINFPIGSEQEFSLEHAEQLISCGHAESIDSVVSNVDEVQEEENKPVAKRGRPKKNG